MSGLGEDRPRTLIIGASRGIGLGIAEHFRRDGHELFVASRTSPADSTGWIACDVRKLEDLQSLAGGLRGRPLANVVYNVGTWESTRFEDTPVEELDDVMSTTLRGVVLLTRLLVEEIRSGGGLLLMIGSTSGLENEGSTAVAYSASKWGLRGAAHALRELLRESGVRVTCLNIGSTASDMPLADRQAVLDRHAGKRMPVEDVVAVVELLGRLSVASCLKEIDMPAQYDNDV